MFSVVFVSLLLYIHPIVTPICNVGDVRPVVTHGMEEESSLDWKSYGDALTEAEKSGKKILVDVYTDWCSWCKKMDKNVYGESSVGEYLRAHFIIVKLNAEAKTKHSVAGEEKSEKQIARDFGIRSFPTTVFLASDAKPITIVPGYIPADKFLLVLRYINEEQYKTVQWEDFLKENS